MNKMTALGATLLLLTATPTLAANPFARVSSLPFHAPPFDKIKDSDYAPAFDEGMKQQRAEIDAIASNSAAPTFDNTIAGMEKSGRMLDRVTNAFFGVVQANTDPALDKVQADEAPKLAAHQDAIYLNATLFARVKASSTPSSSNC
jgi:peptidyl-dipeptidase Dcp